MRQFGTPLQSQDHMDVMEDSHPSQISQLSALDQDYDMEDQDTIDKDKRNARQLSNIAALNTIILLDPTLSNMILHGQGLQQMADALARQGQRWFEQVVVPNGGEDPRLGSMEVDTFHQHLALKYPDPHLSFPNPDMDSLGQDMFDAHEELQ